MATIELDIIKQRSDKLMPSEKRELIEYLAASLAPEESSQIKKPIGSDKNKNPRPEEPSDEEPLIS